MSLRFATSQPQPSPDNRTASRLLLVCSGIYLMHALYAVLVQRHLFGDTSWFLVEMLTTGKPTPFYQNFLHDFYYSRLTAYWLTQLPAVIAIRLGISSIQLISWIFGATYFGLRLLSLLICFRLLGQREKSWIIFPLLGLFAGTITSEMYIVSEANVAVTFLWPILIAIFRETPLSRIGRVITTIAILMASLTYEPWAFFAPILLAGVFLRSTKIAGEHPVPVPFTIALIICAVINWCAILFPRDPANKSGFTQGVFKVISDAATGTPHWHGCVLAATLATLSMLVLIGIPSLSRSKAACFIGAVISLILAIGPPLHFYMNGPSVILSTAIGDRGVGGLVLQMPLLVAFLALILFRAGAVINLRILAPLVLSLAIGQTAWQMMATQAWSNAASIVRHVVTTEAGLVPCETMEFMQAKSEHAPSPSSIMCGSWWVPSYSLLMSKGRQVQAIMVSHNTTSFEPFNPLEPSQLPGTNNKVFDYAPYTKAFESRLNIEPGHELLFGQGGNGFAMIGDGFSHPEDGQTWTDGKKAVLHICLPTVDSGSDSYRINFTLIPYLGSKNQSLVAEIQAGTGSPVTWQFQPSNPPWVSRTLDIHRGDFGTSRCGVIQITFSNLAPSPAEAGTGPDNRHLGLAFSKADVTVL
jgi:hypothetical protein